MIPDYVQLEARKELARRYLYDYCQLKYPKHYTDDRAFLKILCDGIQDFIENSTKHFLVVNVPPRHYKSFTGSNAVEWLLGDDSTRRVMTGSYNEDLSTTFARKVRDTIQEAPAAGVLTYRDIFPKTKIKYGQASASKWSLEGSGYDNYLATSPSGTATGFGADYIFLDDIIKNSTEAYNERVLEGHWDWLRNTMLSRTEGDEWKVIVIMTRWAVGDLAGRIIEEYGDDVEVISFSAVQEDGSMLCDSILSRESYDLKTQAMNPDIVEANYNQKPIDVKGRLYEEFGVWDKLPDGVRKNYTDTADTGSDYLCSVDYVLHEDYVYISDIVFTDEAMEKTEPMVADMLYADGVNEAVFESNNGGRGFARNVERLLKERHNSTKCVIRSEPQTSNKEARILSSSAWVQKHVLMPPNWSNKHKEFRKQLMSYQRKGKNKHDDAADVLAAIYERATSGRKFDFEFL